MMIPVDVAHQRIFEPMWEGDVVVCDIDRTYLATRVSSLQGLARVPFEFAIDKQGIAGMARLLKEVRRGPGQESRQTPLFFVSASPVQLRRVIEKKMLLDGLEFDGTTFKNWGRILCRGKFRLLKEQLAFKLSALLLNRMRFPVGAEEILIGDDRESDPLAFAVYADLITGRIGRDQARSLLARQAITPAEIANILSLRDQIPTIHGVGVKSGYLRLDRYSDPDQFIAYSHFLIVCRDTVQMGLAMWERGSLSLDGAIRVALDMRKHGMDRRRFEEHLNDAHRRGLVSLENLRRFTAQCEKTALGKITLDIGQRDPKWTEHAPRYSWIPERFFE